MEAEGLPTSVHPTALANWPRKDGEVRSRRGHRARSVRRLSGAYAVRPWLRTRSALSTAQRPAAKAAATRKPGAMGLPCVLCTLGGRGWRTGCETAYLSD